jgi:hypothetical protein
VVYYAVNADKVDGKHAAAAGASISQRKGKLVATSGTSGRLPNNIIATAPNAAKLQGLAGNQLVRAAYAQETTPIDDFNEVAFTDIATLDVNAPADGILLVWGNVDAEWISIPWRLQSSSSRESPSTATWSGPSRSRRSMTSQVSPALSRWHGRSRYRLEAAQSRSKRSTATGSSTSKIVR